MKRKNEPRGDCEIVESVHSLAISVLNDYVSEQATVDPRELVELLDEAATLDARVNPIAGRFELRDTDTRQTDFTEVAEFTVSSDGDGGAASSAPGDDFDPSAPFLIEIGESDETEDTATGEGQKMATPSRTQPTAGERDEWPYIIESNGDKSLVRPGNRRYQLLYTLGAMQLDKTNNPEQLDGVDGLEGVVASDLRDVVNSFDGESDSQLSGGAVRTYLSGLEETGLVRLDTADQYSPGRNPTTRYLTEEGFAFFLENGRPSRNHPSVRNPASACLVPAEYDLRNRF